MVTFESLGAVSYSHSIVTTALSFIILEIKQDIGRKSRFFSHPPVVKVPLDARDSSCTSEYWDPAFPHLKFHKSARRLTSTYCEAQSWCTVPSPLHFNRCISLHSDLGVPHRNIAITFVTKNKLARSGYSKVKSVMIHLAVSTQYRRVTDRQTDILQQRSLRCAEHRVVKTICLLCSIMSRGFATVTNHAIRRAAWHMQRCYRIKYDFSRGVKNQLTSRRTSPFSVRTVTSSPLVDWMLARMKPSRWSVTQQDVLASYGGASSISFLRSSARYWKSGSPANGLANAMAQGRRDRNDAIWRNGEKVRRLAWHDDLLVAPTHLQQRIKLNQIKKWPAVYTKLSRSGLASVSVVETLKCGLGVTQSHQNWHHSIITAIVSTAVSCTVVIDVDYIVTLK